MGIVIVSDTHIGDYPYGKTDTETGLNKRLLDFLNNLEVRRLIEIDRATKTFKVKKGLKSLSL